MQAGNNNNDPATPALIQREVDLTTVLALGFSDDWGHPKNRLERDKMNLEHIFLLDGDLGLMP